MKSKYDNQKSWIREFSKRRYQTLLRGESFVPHQREFHIVATLLEGALIVMYRERNYAISAGDSIFIPAGELHAFSATENEAALVNFHYIDTVDAYIAGEGLMCPSVDILLRTKTTTQRWAPTLLSDLELHLSHHFYMKWLSCFLFELSEHLGNVKVIEELDIDSFMNARTYIQDYVQEPFRLDDISKRFNINRWQLSRKFKPLFGLTLFQHIHASRVVRAKELLSQNYSIITVANELGYSDQPHFTRFFKRFVGISPNKWVKLVSMSKRT